MTEHRDTHHQYKHDGAEKEEHLTEGLESALVLSAIGTPHNGHIHEQITNTREKDQLEKDLSSQRAEHEACQ